MKRFLKLIKEKLFNKPSSTELILVIVVVAVFVLKLKSEPKNNVPVGDFGPSPYTKHLESSGKNGFK